MNLKEKIAKIKAEYPNIKSLSMIEREGIDVVDKFINDAKHILNKNKKILNMDANSRITEQIF